MKRREFITLIGGAAAAWPIATRAQQPARLPTIGYLSSGTPSSAKDWIDAFVQRLSELRWVVGNTVAIEYRWAEARNDRFPSSRPSSSGLRSMSSSQWERHRFSR
jgi:putative ABC transport system substrate-binding protein